MGKASFRFYASLNDFLPPAVRQSSFVHSFNASASVKDMIEAIGAPHTEVELILVGGRPVDFTYIVADGDRLSVYPFFESLNISPLLRVRPRQPDQIRFVLDGHLGKLAAYLRMLGFDALYRNDCDDDELAEISSREERILLTRDCGLLKRSVVKLGYKVRETDPRKQLLETIRRFDLIKSLSPFRRCLRCNGLLELISKEAITDRLQP